MYSVSSFLPSLWETLEWDNDTFGFIGEACNGPPTTVRIDPTWFAPSPAEIVNLDPFEHVRKAAEAGDLAITIPSLANYAASTKISAM